MKTLIALLILLTLSRISIAMRPPEIQDQMDRDIMDQYLHNHPNLTSKVKEVDYTNFKIYLKDNCTLIFNREFQFRLPGWVGGAASLKYSRKDCDFESESPGFLD